MYLQCPLIMTCDIYHACIFSLRSLRAHLSFDLNHNSCPYTISFLRHTIYYCVLRISILSLGMIHKPLAWFPFSFLNLTLIHGRLCQVTHACIFSLSKRHDYPLKGMPFLCHTHQCVTSSYSTQTPFTVSYSQFCQLYGYT